MSGETPSYEARERNAERLVRRYRKKKNWDQSRLAAEMTDKGFPGWNQYTVVSIETGDRKMTLQEAMALTDVLGITEAWFWEEKGRDL